MARSSRNADPASNAHQVHILVRSYELDALGHVNNAVYLNYFEHARVTFMRDRGVDFQEFIGEGFQMVIAESALKFRSPAFLYDELVVDTNATVEGVRLVFEQEITRPKDQRRIASGRNVIAVMNAKGRPIVPPADLQKKLGIA